MSYNNWEEEDPYSSGDEIATERRTISRDRRTTRNITEVESVISQAPASDDPQNRTFISALSTIREYPAIRDQLKRIEQIFTLNQDKVLADVMYTEVTLAIVQAARAVSIAGKRGEAEEGESEEESMARMSARRRTLGNFGWREEGSASTAEGAARTTNEQQGVLKTEGQRVSEVTLRLETEARS